MMSERAYALRLIWRWEEGAHPGKRALDGLRLLLRYLGFNVAMLSRGPKRFEFRLHPREPGTMHVMSGLRRLHAWEDTVLRDYPGTAWDIMVELAPGRGEGSPRERQGCEEATTLTARV